MLAFRGLEILQRGQYPAGGRGDECVGAAMKNGARLSRGHLYVLSELALLLEPDIKRRSQKLQIAPAHAQSLIPRIPEV